MVAQCSFHVAPMLLSRAPFSLNLFHLYIFSPHLERDLNASLKPTWLQNGRLYLVEPDLLPCSLGTRRSLQRWGQPTWPTWIFAAWPGPGSLPFLSGRDGSKFEVFSVQSHA